MYNQMAWCYLYLDPRSSSHPSTVNDKRLPANVVTRPTSKEDNCSLEIAGRTPSLSGDTLHDLS